MIKLMLRNPMQHVIKVVPLSRNPIPEPRFRQHSNSPHELIVRPLRRSYCLPPRPFRRLWHRRKILETRRLPLLPIKSAQRSVVPHGNMQHQFPNAVKFRQRLCRSSSGVHILQQFEHSRPVPRAAIKSAAQLLRDAGSFRFFLPLFHSDDSFNSPRPSRSPLHWPHQ